MKDLRDVIYAMELRSSVHDKEATQDFQSLLDELKNKVKSVRWVVLHGNALIGRDSINQ